MAVIVGEKEARWWLAPTFEEQARIACAVAERIVGNSSSRHAMDLRNLRLYGNQKTIGLGPHQIHQAHGGDRLTLNVVAACVDTAAAKIAKNRPAPQFVTNGADWTVRRKAKKLNIFGKGCLHQSQAYERAPRIFRDAAIFGTGIARVFSRERRIQTERVFPWDLLVDDRDALHGEPRMMMQRRFIDRAVLLERFPKSTRVIQETKSYEREATGRDYLADQVEVIEAWHLPSSKTAKDGRHIICVEGGCLFSEPWKRERFPFAVMRWEEPVAGFWGTGIAERLTGLQFELNTLLRKVQQTMHLLGNTRVILDAGAGIPESHINNEVGAILVKNPGSTPPQVVPAQTIHPEVFSQIDRLYQRAFEEVGISQLAASSRKPAGLDSGAALREFNDIETERFSLVGKRWEAWHLDIVRIAIDEAREIPGGFSVDTPMPKGVRESVKWAEVSLEDDAYTLQCFPASILPQTPAGRLQKGQELVQSGLVPQDRVMEMLDIPDFDAYTQEQSAPGDTIDWAIDHMLDSGKYVQPEPLMNLELAIARTKLAYNIELRLGAPEDRLELLRRFTVDAEALLPKPAPMAAPMPGEPMAPPVEALPPMGMAA